MTEFQLKEMVERIVRSIDYDIWKDYFLPEGEIRNKDQKKLQEELYNIAREYNEKITK